MGKLDDSDDMGFRTPTAKHKRRRETSKHKREGSKKETASRKREGSKKETGSRKRERGEASPSKKRETGKHEAASKKRETGKHEREEAPKKRETGKHERELAARSEAPPLRGSKGSPVPMIAGAAVALVVGVIVIAVMSADPPPPKQVANKGPKETFVITPAPVAAQPTQPAPPPEPTALPEATPPEGLQEVVAAPTEEPKSDALEELAKKSSTHAALARILEEYAGLFDPATTGGGGPLLQSFRERQAREAELLAQIRAMGPSAVDALKDMLLGLDRRQHRIFLGKALAGIEGPTALAAVTAVLGEIKDVALQTTLVRFLPETPDAAEAVGAAIAGEENGNLRCMLLREYHRRLGQDDTSGRELFANAALQDPDANVRAEAVTIIGRRGDSRDQALMEQIIAKEENLSIRQRAIVSYAETGKEASLPFLENLVREPGTALPVRASAVLAIGRVGGQNAISSLDTIAQTDTSQEIRVRAERLAQSLRRRAEQPARDPSRVPTRQPMPSPVPLRRGGR